MSQTLRCPLLELHPDAGDFKIAPEAHTALPLDIVSEAAGLVGAETFSAVDLATTESLLRILPSCRPGRIYTAMSSSCRRRAIAGSG